MALEIKDGDTVVCINAGDWALTHGREYTALSGTDDHYVRVVSDNGREANYYQDRFSIAHSIESPIRTVTRREIAYGDYGRVKVILAGYSGDSPSHKRWVSLGDFGSQDWNADELRSAAMVLSQLAEFLDEDKGDE